MSKARVLKEVLERIKLSRAEVSVLTSVAREVVATFSSAGLKAQIGGSLAKGTMIKMREKPDIDIFVVFAYSEDILALGKKLKKMKLPGKLKVVHGSRDYFQLELPEAVLEIIPVVKLRDPALAENVTDVSLSHVRYVKTALKKRPHVLDEILLTKAFFKAQGLYGAESYLKGFSGYSLEVLTIYFGSFVKLLKGLGKKRVIDSVRQFRNEAEVLREINASKLTGPLVVVGPTYKYRNVTAGLGEEVYEKFLNVAKAFLKKPTKAFFEKKAFDLGAFKKLAKQKGAALLEVILSTSRQEGDIAGTKMKKFFDFFIDELKRKQQTVLAKAFMYSGKGKAAKGYVVVKETKEIVVKGPSNGLDVAVKEFKKARGKNAFRRGKFWYAKEKTSAKNIFEKCKTFEKEMSVKVSLGAI